MLNIHSCRIVVGDNRNFPWSIIIQLGEGDFILSSYGVSDDYLVDVIELVPIFIKICEISIQRFKFRPSWNSGVQSLGGEKGFEIKEIIVVFIYNI